MARLPIHPGEVLAEDLKELDMSAAALARRLRAPANRITEIVNGQRAITGDTAPHQHNATPRAGVQAVLYVSVFME
jgi:addiction module HigA family antidote